MIITFDGPTRFFISHIESADQMEQVIGDKPHFQLGFFSSEPMATCLVPAQRVFALFDPVFDVAPPVIKLDHRKGRQPGIGYDEIASGKQLTHMPLDLGNYSSGFIPALGLICHIHIFDLDTTSRWTPTGVFRYGLISLASTALLRNRMK